MIPFIWNVQNRQIYRFSESRLAVAWGWGQEEKGTTEDERAGWHHRLDGCESG